MGFSGSCQIWLSGLSSAVVWRKAMVRRKAVVWCSSVEAGPAGLSLAPGTGSRSHRFNAALRWGFGSMEVLTSLTLSVFLLRALGFSRRAGYGLIFLFIRIVGWYCVEMLDKGVTQWIFAVQKFFWHCDDQVIQRVAASRLGLPDQPMALIADRVAQGVVVIFLQSHCRIGTLQFWPLAQYSLCYIKVTTALEITVIFNRWASFLETHSLQAKCSIRHVLLLT